LQQSPREQFRQGNDPLYYSTISPFSLLWEASSNPPVDEGSLAMVIYEGNITNYENADLLTVRKVL